MSTQDEKRLKKQCAKVVDHHFNGEYGIVAELQDIGIMDAEGHIKDPRRILWRDESPQMMDYACKGRRDRAIGIKGVRLQAPDKVNRELISVCMCQDLSGFQYGPQLNMKRSTWTGGLTDCMDTPEWAQKFDDKIFPLDKKSTYLCMVKSENGMQTGATLIEYIESLHEQIKARSKLEAADRIPGLPRWRQPLVPLRARCAEGAFRRGQVRFPRLARDLQRVPVPAVARPDQLRVPLELHPGQEAVQGGMGCHV